jgi:hypothetical protein
MEGTSMTVNAKISGILRVRLVDLMGKPIKDFDWVEVRGDSVAHRVAWKNSLKTLGKDPVRIEFELRDAQLFAVDLHD